MEDYYPLPVDSSQPEAANGKASGKANGRASGKGGGSKGRKRVAASPAAAPRSKRQMKQAAAAEEEGPSENDERNSGMLSLPQKRERSACILRGMLALKACFLHDW